VVALGVGRESLGSAGRGSEGGGEGGGLGGGMDAAIGLEVRRGGLGCAGRGSEMKATDRAPGWTHSQEHEDVEDGEGGGWMNRVEVGRHRWTTWGCPGLVPEIGGEEGGELGDEMGALTGAEGGEGMWVGGSGNEFGRAGEWECESTRTEEVMTVEPVDAGNRRGLWGW
jgi:hypothetical protein